MRVRQFECVREAERRSAHVKQRRRYAWSDGSQDKYISRRRRGGRRKEEVEEGGGCLGDDRKKIRPLGGSGMKSKRGKERKKKTVPPILSVISCDVKVGRWRGKGI